MRRIAIAAAVLLTACGSSEQAAEENTSPSPAQTRFEAAYSDCTSLDRIELADEGTSILADGPPDSLYKANDQFIEDIACILGSLNTPDYVIEQIDNTTSLMGLREATWDGIEASWSYHPDNGFDLVLRDTQAGE